MCKAALPIKYIFFQMSSLFVSFSKSHDLNCIFQCFDRLLLPAQKVDPVCCSAESWSSVYKMLLKLESVNITVLSYKNIYDIY